ncbi:MAG: peptidoglycan-associated lipoprotein Pal [Rhizobiales bacterium]|nr:peptidoglycan-associated lipoprotein Pal [Hyphomicrobiales bacterium]
MSTGHSILKSPAIVAVVLGLALAGCASKPKIPTNAGGLGLNSSNINGAVAGSQQDFTVNVGDRVFFTTDSTSLTDVAQQTLAGQASWLLRYPNYPITVEGHADERGTREYNLALGARRAAATRDYLVSRGVPRSRIRTISFGKERPVAVCNDISCWSQNRRAVTLLTAPTG